MNIKLTADSKAKFVAACERIAKRTQYSIADVAWRIAKDLALSARKMTKVSVRYRDVERIGGIKTKLDVPRWLVLFYKRNGATFKRLAFNSNDESQRFVKWMKHVKGLKWRTGAEQFQTVDILKIISARGAAKNSWNQMLRKLYEIKPGAVKDAAPDQADDSRFRPGAASGKYVINTPHHVKLWLVNNVYYMRKIHPNIMQDSMQKAINRIMGQHKDQEKAAIRQAWAA